MARALKLAPELVLCWGNYFQGRIAGRKTDPDVGLLYYVQRKIDEGNKGRLCAVELQDFPHSKNSSI